MASFYICNMQINIAIDGFSSCGKSTLTKQLAKHLQYTYIDTGAMYRAVTLYFINNSISFQNSDEVNKALANIQLNFEQINDNSHILLNGKDVEDEIRSMKVSNYVSEVAAISAVRTFLVKQQQQLAKQKGVIMDGRDIGTVVLPNAELKIFMTADKEVRIQRRYDELKANGLSITKKEVSKNLEQRDFIDSHRQDSPLTKTEDAILLDNTHLNEEEQLQFVLNLVNKRLNEQ